MYHFLILSFSLIPILGLALPTAQTTGTNTAPAERSLPDGTLLETSGNVPKTNGIADLTNLLQTVNYFPDPVVKCSGRKLDDNNSNWSKDLAAAVTGSTTSGLYGTCDAQNTEVDGSGNLAWKSGKVQVYYCNSGFTPNPCSVNEYWRADALITEKCGSNGGGWVSVSDWGKTIGRDPTKSDGGFRSECGASLHGAKANVLGTSSNSTRTST